MKRNLLFLAVSVLVLSSCKKDKAEECPVTVEGLSGTFKLTSLVYVQTSSSDPQDWYEQVVDDCKKDDSYVLAANGDFNILDMGTVCQPSGSFQGIWTLQDNYINMDGFYAGTVESYNCQTLVFSQTDALVDGDKLTATFVKQ
jgi:hypothetical protein